MLNKLHPFSIPLQGQHLVEASAGTGKTYNITSLFIRCLLDKKMDVDEILVLTYTKAATAELKERIMSRLRDSVAVLNEGQAPEKDEFLGQLLDYVEQPKEAAEQLEKGLHNFDEASIFTIHSFCQRALQEQSFLSGIVFDTELITDDSGLIQEVIDDWWRKLVERAEESEHDRIWLNILKDENYLPDELAEMVSVGLGKPYLNLSLNETNESSRQEELKELYQLFEKLKENWFGNEAQIQQLLLSDAMNGNRYRSSSVPGWVEELTGWLNNDIPSLNYIDKFDRFSIDFIREKGTKKGREHPQHPFFYCVKAFIEQAARVRSWIPAFKKELLEYARETVRNRKLTLGVLGYDDLLVLLKEALNRPQTGPKFAKFLRRKFPVALVDEFQDTDPIQYNILETIYPARSTDTALFLVGDPKQSIYSFRGADVFSYLQARSGVAESRQYSLKRNFRSDPDLIEAVNRVFGRTDDPFWVEKIKFTPAVAADITKIPPFLSKGEKSPPLTFLESAHSGANTELKKADARDRAARVTAESISRLLNRGESGNVTLGDNPVRPKDVAILVRTHRQANLVREELEKRRIKCVQYSEKSVFDTDEARNLELLLQAVAEPRNEKLVRTALATELFSYDARDLLRYEEQEEAWTDKLARFSHWNRIWQERGFTSMFRSFLREAEVERHLVSLNQGERKLTNTLQLGELLQAREQEQQGGMFELVKWLAHKREEPDKSAEEEQLRLESDEELVRIVTMHRSKGLEYPVVYCPFLWDGAHFSDSGDPFLYHDEQNEYKASLDLNEKGDSERQVHRLYAARETLSESLRLAYVALTRAKQHCTIVYESASGIEFSPLGYLLLGRQEIEQQLEAKILSNSDAPSLDPENYYRELETLLEENSPVIGHEKIDEEEITNSGIGSRGEEAARENRTFPEQKQVRSRAVVSSFSSIMHPSSAPGDERPGDEIFFPEELDTPEEGQSPTIFSFPRGPKAGNCVHTIFEDLHFPSLDNLDEVVETNLDQFGFDTDWAEVVNRMVRTVIKKPLHKDIKLERLKEQDLIKEMEFYFSSNLFERNALLRIIRGEDAGRGFRVPEGFMKGYIDLTFNIDNCYYIADYKTNYLGDSAREYNPEILRDEMETAGYDVQYHIYSVALHRYLQKRLPNYSYDRHFGGIFYLFVRGMSGGAGQEGIYYDKPDEVTINQLDQLFQIKSEG